MLDSHQSYPGLFLSVGPAIANMDSDDALDSELLELIEADPQKKKRKRATKTKSSASSIKRRKAEASDSDHDGPESEEDEDPYPLEGRYVDAADRERLMQMPEIEREEIITGRLEEKQRAQDRKAVSQMVRNQQHGGNVDSVSSAAKRQHTARGATKEKSRKLDELKAKRKAKDDKKSNRNDSPKRERSSSPMDMETSDEGEDGNEDGQISKREQDDDRERRLTGKASSPDDQPATLHDLQSCQLTRDMITKYCRTPWFEDLVKGSWVRYLIGQEDGAPVYRICEVTNLGAQLAKPYKINNTMTNLEIELKHGKSVKLFAMDRVSNAFFLEREFDRLVRVCETEKVNLPSKRALERKLAEMNRLSTQPLTESDISAMLARKNQLMSSKPPGWAAIERSRLVQERTLAQRRHDFDEVAEIDAKLVELEPTDDVARKQEAEDMLAKVSERNRRANMEAMRRLEAAEAERRRKERKLALAGKSGTATPTDPSARLKTVPRMFNHAGTVSRPGTPSTPLLQPQGKGSVSPLPQGKAKSFETSVIDSIDLDLGDF